MLIRQSCTIAYSRLAKGVTFDFYSYWRMSVVIMINLNTERQFRVAWFLNVYPRSHKACLLEEVQL